MKKISKFIKSNKGLTKGLVVAFVIFVSYELTMDLDEIIPYGDFLYNLASNLSLAYMGSFIFYVIQVYIPEIKNKKVLKENIKRKLYLILNKMESLLTYLSKRYLNKDKIDNLTKEECKEITILLDTREESPMVDLNLNHVSLLVFINHHISKSEDCINSLYDTMVLYLEPELVKILDSIKESTVSYLFKSMANCNTPGAIDELDGLNMVYDYYCLYTKLKKYYDEL